MDFETNRFFSTSDPSRFGRTRMISGVLLTVGMLFGVAPAWSQGTITSGTATFERIHYLADNLNNCNYFIDGGLDNVFEDAWYFRVAGDSDETAFTAPQTESYTGPVGEATWSNVASRNLFDARLSATVYDGSSGTSSHIVNKLTITNISSEPLDIDIFGYLDFDLADTLTDDQAVLLEDPVLVRVSDSTTFGEFQGPGAIGVQASDTADLAVSIRELMQDGLVTNFDGSGFPFTTGDWEGAFQWHAVIPPGGSETFTKAYSVNQGLGIIFSDGFESGDTSAW